MCISLRTSLGELHVVIEAFLERGLRRLTLSKRLSEMRGQAARM